MRCRINKIWSKDIRIDVAVSTQLLIETESMATRQNFIVQVANVSKDAPLDVEKWICVYPAYIDQERTLKEGRRLSKENCTKNPDAYAIYYVCAVLLKLQVALECKRYSRSWWDYVGRGVGRVKVNLLNEKGEKELKDPTSDIIFDSRKKLFARVAAL